MSMPSICLKCEKCGCHGDTFQLWGNYAYLVDGLEVSMSRQLGFCFDCNGLKPMELFDMESCRDTLVESVSSLKKIEASTLSTFRRSEKSHYLTEIAKATHLLYIAAKRQGNERCLECGKTHISPFEGDYKLEYNGTLYMGSKRTGFVHPNCGGEFVATPNPVRLHMAFKSKFYDLDGKKI